MAFKMNYSKGGFPYKSSFPTNNDNKGVYITVDGVPMTYGEYKVYDKTGRMPSGSKSRRNQQDIDLSDIVKNEESRGIVAPKPKKEDLSYIDDDDAPPPEWETE